MDSVRRRKLKLNTWFGVSNQIVLVICGLILPRMILKAYGSQINGLVNSVTNILGMISLLEMGMGAVVQSSLYRPIAENNSTMINLIYNSARGFFQKISFVFLGFIALLCVAFPLYFRDSYDVSFTILLILSISISMFAQYYFGIVNALLLQADQFNYLYFIIQIITTVLNTAICYLEIKVGCSILLVKLTTSLVFLLRPAILYLVVKSKYDFLTKERVTEHILEQRWDGFAQHIAAYVLQNTDVLVLTFLSTFENVSIYSVYYLIARSLVQLIVSYMSGYQSLMGNMIAKKEQDNVASFFDKKEAQIHILSSIIFTIAIIMAVPFVKIYTSDIIDADYVQPLFSCLLLTSQWLWCLRMFYYIPVKAVGDYKKTRTSSIIEASLNISISVIVVWKYGLCGVAIGTLVSILYRVICLICYSYKHVVFKKGNKAVKWFVMDLVMAVLSIALMGFFDLSAISYLSWAVKAFVTTLAVVGLGCVVYGVGNGKTLLKWMQQRVGKTK